MTDEVVIQRILDQFCDAIKKIVAKIRWCKRLCKVRSSFRHWFCLWALPSEANFKASTVPSRTPRCQIHPIMCGISHRSCWLPSPFLAAWISAALLAPSKPRHSLSRWRLSHVSFLHLWQFVDGLDWSQNQGITYTPLLSLPGQSLLVENCIRYYSSIDNIIDWNLCRFCDLALLRLDLSATVFWILKY